MKFILNNRHISLLLLAFLAWPGLLRGQDIDALPDEKPFTANGSVGLALSGYSVSGMPQRRSPFSWILNGSVTPVVYGIQIPLSFVFSEQERGYTQPFNQFGMSPTYKWVTAHLGYRSMTMSRYTLGGASFLGVGVEANPGIVRLAAMYGRFQRAVEEDTTEMYNAPAYQRTGFALKLGFGDESTGYFDISYLRAKDDTNSLRTRPEKSGVSPEENAALGFSARFPIVPELSLDADGGATIITRDVRAERVNIDSASIPQFLLGFYDARASTSLLFALRAGLNFVIPHLGVRLGYERVEPDYETLGAYAFTTDMENWTIAPSFDVLDGRLRFNGSLGIQRDNLLGNKSAGTSRLISSANVGWAPDEIFAVDAQFSNYSTDQKSGRTALNDTVRVKNVTQSLSLTPRVLLQTPELNHSIIVTGSYQAYSDNNTFATAAADNQTVMLSANYGLTLVKDGISGGGTLMYSGTTAGTVKINTVGFGLNGSTALLDSKMSLGASLGYSIVGGSGSSAGVFNESLSSSYRPTDQDSFTAGITAVQRGASADVPAFSEFTMSVSYNRTFTWEP